MDNESEIESSTGSVARNVLIGLLVLALVGAGVLAVMLNSTNDELERTKSALELQSVTSRLGAAAIHAEHGQYADAQSLMSGVYDAIRNHGIRRGILPENYERVLRTRDEVIVALSREIPDVTERLVSAFFLLQLPIDTELSSEYILPATDSGAGMTPPRRVPAGQDSSTGSGFESDTIPVPTDRPGSRPDSAVRPDTVGGG